VPSLAKARKIAGADGAPFPKIGFVNYVRILFHAMTGNAMGAARVLAKSKAFHVDVDPKDPDFAPINGVGVDDYAAINHDIWKDYQAKKFDEADRQAIIKRHNIDPAAFDASAKEWNDRIDRNGHVQMRYANTFVMMR
jgi:hypothetical protein